MTNEILAGIAGPILFIACVFQLITLRHSDLDRRPIAKNGKRVMAAGFFIAALRFWFLPFFPVPLGVLSWIMIAIGSLMMNFDRILDTCEAMRNQEEVQHHDLIDKGLQ